MDHLHLNGLFAFPSITSLAQINGMIYLLLPVYSYQQPSSTADKYFDFSKCVRRRYG